MRAPLTAVVIITMQASLALAYRTASELPEIDGAPVGRANRLVEYRVDLAGLRGLNLSAVERAIHDGFSVWSNPSCAEVTFRQVGSGGVPASDDGYSDVSFVRSEWTAQGFPEGAAGATDVLYEMQPDGHWEIVEADVWLNAWDYEWTTAEPMAEELSIFSVAAHEGGHMLGILHPCEIGDAACDPEAIHSTSVMHPLYSGGRELSEDDESAVCALYPTTCMDCPPRECDPACSIDEMCVRGTCVATPVGQIGDPCVSDGECVTTHCDSSGVCRRACAADAECTDGSCVDGACIAGATGFGELCASGDECASGLCVLRGHEGACTRACGTSCPGGTTCESVDGRDVCVAPRASSCSAGSASGFGWMVLLFCGVLFRRGRWM